MLAEPIAVTMMAAGLGVAGLLERALNEVG
jgi:hypothetical protein